MRTLNATFLKGLLSLDERVPPSPKVVENLTSTLRVLAKVCVDHGVGIELSHETLDLWRSARFEAGNRSVSMAVRLKELCTFAVWCDLDEQLVERLSVLKDKHERAARGRRKRKDEWMLANDTRLKDVWDRAVEQLELALAAPVGTAERARRTLDAACLAMSVVCPLRCGDLHRILFGTQLRRHAGHWSLEIETAKTGRKYWRPKLWPELTPFLDAVLLLDTPGNDLWAAYDRKAGTPLFSRDGGASGVRTEWPSQCWLRHFRIGEHIVRTMWHTMMFESEDDDQWIALVLCGQGNGRTALEYIVQGNQLRAARRARAKLRGVRQGLAAS